jgi:hypothetical protein
MESSRGGIVLPYLLFVGLEEEDIQYGQQRECDHRDENNRPDDA